MSMRNFLLFEIAGLTDEEKKTKVCDVAGDCFKKGEYYDAVECYKFLNDKLGLTLYGAIVPEFYNFAGDCEKAVEYMDEFVKDEKNMQFLTSDIIGSESLFNYALANYTLGNLKKARELFRQTADLCEKYHYKTEDQKNLLQIRLSTCYAFIGKIFMDLEDYFYAKKMFEQSLDVCLNVFAYFYAAKCLLRGTPGREEQETALDFFLECTEVQLERLPAPMDFSDKCIVASFYEAGKLYASLKGNASKAEKYLNRAKEMGYKVTDSEIANILNSCPKKRGLFGKFF